MPQYMLLLRDDPSVFADLSPEEMQRVLQRYGDWRRSLQNRIPGGHKLKDGEGRVMRAAGKAQLRHLSPRAGRGRNSSLARISGEGAPKKTTRHL